MSGTARLHAMLYHHLQHNHYPAVSEAFIPTAEAAIDAGNDADWERVITLPTGKQMTARQILEELHLQDFLEPEDEE